MATFCERCQEQGRVLRTMTDGRRVRECSNGHRWATYLKEIRDTDATEPARPETVLSMYQAGKSVRQIAGSLMMSTRTVQELLQKHTTTLEEVWR